MKAPSPLQVKAALKMVQNNTPQAYAVLFTQITNLEAEIADQSSLIEILRTNLAQAGNTLAQREEELRQLKAQIERSEP